MVVEGRAGMVRVMEVFRWDSGTPLGEFLRGRRRVAGWTQRGLADAAGLSVGVVRDLEQGVSAPPRPGSVERLAVVLGVAPEEAAGPDPSLVARESRRYRGQGTPAVGNGDAGGIRPRGVGVDEAGLRDALGI